MEPHAYSVNLTYTAGRRGLLQSDELNTPLEVATPPQFPKGEAGIWSPEHLFTAAVSSCFMTTFLAIAENSRLEFGAFSCAAQGMLELADGKYRMTEVVLQPELELLKEADQERAVRILQKAEAACLITNSITAKVSLQPRVSVKQPVA